MRSLAKFLQSPLKSRIGSTPNRQDLAEVVHNRRESQHRWYSQSTPEGMDSQVLTNSPRKSLQCASARQPSRWCVGFVGQIHLEPYLKCTNRSSFKPMPELPEVECVRKGILETSLGHSITKVWSQGLQHLLDPQSLPLTKLKGQHIRSIERRGKYLRWILPDFQLFAHLGMSGVWSHNGARQKHTHLELTLSDGAVLRYTDPRQFGYLCLLPIASSSSRWDSLGPDGISKSFTADYLWQATRNSKAPIKVWIMDQHKIAGVGNIYASEALFRACISPTRPASTLCQLDCRNLRSSIKSILKLSIKNRGTTFSDYRLTNGRGGEFQSFLQVFQKTGKPCPHCRQGILQITQTGRSTFYCANCQK